MARRPRGDEPDTWHHVTNRGIAKRPLFEKRDDKRFFLARLARQVRQGRIEIHAFCLMTTHFHLLVRSPRGELSEAMRRAQNEHSRRFNRRNRRDGSLVRGRYFSRRVRSVNYRRTLVRYIDANPVKAGMTRWSGEYEFGSAAAYMAGSGPGWLSRGWIEAEVCRSTGSEHFTPAAYRATFRVGASADLADLTELVEARLERATAVDPLEDLVGNTPDQVQAWMQRKATLADGHRLGLPICGRRALRRAIDMHVEAHGDWFVQDGRIIRPGAELAWIGLLRDLCGLTWDEIARLEARSPAQTRRLGATHCRLLGESTAYAERAGQVGQAALTRCLGPLSE